MSIRDINPWLILRIGLFLTFIWVGYLVLREPLVWGSYINKWVLEFIPLDIKRFMMITGIVDILIGVSFLHRRTVFLASVFGSLHLASILLVSGVNEATVRDIGLLGGTISIFIKYLPKKFIL